MNTMCNACSDGQNVLGHEVDCKSCSASFCLDLEKRELAIDIKHLMYSHTSLSDKYATDQPSTELIVNPLNSAFVCGSSISEMNSHVSENGDEAVDIYLEQPKRSTEDAEVTESSKFSEVFIDSTSDFTTGLDRIGEATLSGETFRSRISALESYENSKDEKLHHADNSQGDLQSVGLRAGDDLDKVENGITSNSLALSLLKTDPLIWKPPEAANIEDDMDSVANNDDDDDDDYSDGTKWGQSTSLGDFDKIHGNSYKEARQKAMVAAMNGQFKILVSRFLASEGLASIDEGHSPGWLDIVTSLSWEAALFIKPDAKEGGAMDPGSYVKVKCVASGARNQSQVIKGLIFKKNAAHKHMPTKFKNPRLLLVKGVLGQSELGLSSFRSMDQEKDYLKSINEMIEACHPNLVLVEKSVSRDIQEFLLAKGMTLVFDMKIARLERIARCTGSQIIPSANILTNLNIKQCDSFHIEKLTEEHNSSTEVGKKASKTLMFLEGFSKPLGCTILLKGAHIDELKRVKRVVQYTIFAAYHLILETSFFADQRALFSNIDGSEGNDASIDKAIPTIAIGAAPCSNSSDTPASNGFLEYSAHEGFYTAHLDASRSPDDPGFVGNIDFCEDNFKQGRLPRSLSNENEVNLSSSLSTSDLPLQLMSSFSASLRNLLSDNRLRPFTSESISSFCAFKNEEHDYPSLNGLPISSSAGNMDDGMEANDNIMEEKPNNESPDTLSILIEPVQYSNADGTKKVETEGKDDSDGVLNSESILVLLSSQCIEKGLVCEQSHLSRIKYYGNFDVSLGRYLQDVLLNQKHTCSSCGEPPEAHIYCYTHQNGNLTVLVRQLSSTSSLLGEAEGKIWMWSRCLKCEHENGIPKTTKRVVMSTAARSLSFGKFLELSFTSHSAASRLSSECGHSLHRDCLRFFGLGSKVAMFRYSPVEIYAACRPPPVLEFAIPSKQDWVVQEAKSVLQRGDILFSEVANFLCNLKKSCSGPFSDQYKNFPGFVKSICEAEDMLKQEKAEFKAALFKAVNYTGQLEKSVNEILGLNWFNQELLLELYIWDRRLHQFSQISKDFDRSHDENGRYMGNDRIEIGDVQRSTSDIPIDIQRTTSDIPIDIQRSTSDSSCNNQNHCYPEPDTAYNSAETSHSSGFDEMECSIEAASFEPSAAENAPTTVGQSFDTANSAFSSSPDISSIKEYEEECSGHSDVSDIEMMNDNTISGIGLFFASALKAQHSSAELLNDPPDFEDPESLIWVPFSELRSALKKDLNGGYLHKFSFIRTYTPKYLSPMHQLFPQERGLLHYPVGASRTIMSVCEDEISSIIACALALSDDQNSLLETMDVKNSYEGKMDADKEIDNPSNLVTEVSVTSNGSFDPVGMHLSRSFSSFSSDDFSTLALESALSMDRLITSENLHPEIPLGIGKEGLKKYSVVCIHAKQFYALRKMCCPSEQAYISSLSRCRKWDAQGGKSKAFFAKSMDDRFIIKEIKKTELDSFLKFAPDYFKHFTHSLSTGSQTCLAKILGIYQVRLTKSGKEVKVLMVMENLLFGHNVTRTYDLKGAVFSRYISDVNDPEKVLLDQNFVEDMRLSPIYVGGKTKHLFQRAIWNDTSFLYAINVMDYSLLVGVDSKQQRLVFGIIDYLRQFTWDKQLETWVKASLVVPKNSLPTIISPKEYKKRFRKFMSRYFLTVPDWWCSTECSEPCKFCTGGNSKLSSSHGSEPPQRDV